MSRVLLFFLCFLYCSAQAQPNDRHQLKFSHIPEKWDEALPLGNGTLGVLIWQKDKKLRMALDNVFLWDDRPMPEIEKLTFGWVVSQVEKNDYQPVQKLGDEPYEANAAPTKIPAAAIEFATSHFGNVVESTLDIKTAVASFRWQNGVKMESYVHASENFGFFEFKNLKQKLEVEIVPPKYQSTNKSNDENSVVGSNLEKLAYSSGTIIKTNKQITYFQPCHQKTWYKVIINYQQDGSVLRGNWTIIWNNGTQVPNPPTFPSSPRKSHEAWWKKFWNKSSVQLPDSILERQYYLEMYKFGSTARSNTPPISLQAVWTADNGRLPPWKGDFHHDLNTQLSYWPGYISNHVDLTVGFTNWLWNIRSENRRWTMSYFGVDGINVPGVTTISGKEMGGWIQYSMSPTTIAWLSQHFYWQYKYGQDKSFLTSMCLPYFKEAEKYFSNVLKMDDNGRLALPLSSSPEIHDNSIKAWFKGYTNYDLALLIWFYNTCYELFELTDDPESVRIGNILKALPPLSVNDTGLMVAADEDLMESHRHLSNYMAIFPLEIININENKEIIERSIRHIEKLGTKAWVGYSFSWMAIVYAKAKKAEKAADILRKFATNFTSANSFHLNGDQKGGQYSGYTYRPFTLEGNFAFARGIQELLFCSKGDRIELFPAIPQDWQDVEFSDFQSINGVNVSAKMEAGHLLIAKFKARINTEISVNIDSSLFQISGIDQSRIIAQNDRVVLRLLKNETAVFKRKSS